MSLFGFRRSPDPIALAHCDVPCGIYDPAKAQSAALSVVRFLDLLAEYEGAELALQDHVRIARLVQNKEEHAGEVKSEVIIIWGDYLKPEHFAAHPTLHDLTHRVLKCASACRQGTDPAQGRELVTLVNEFAAIFWQIKGVETQVVRVPYEPKLDIVSPIFPSA